MDLNCQIQSAVNSFLTHALGDGHVLRGKFLRAMIVFSDSN